MSRTKLSLGVMIATLLAVVTLFFLPAPQAMVLQTTRVRPGNIQKTCMLDGEATYRNRQPLIAPVSGQVEKIYVESGQWVEKGQLLLRMSTAEEEMALSQLAKQQYQLQNSLSTVTGQQPWSAADLMAYLTNQKQSLLSSIALKQIRANCDGRIENLYVKSGDYLSAAGLMGTISEREMTVSAAWISHQGATPVPGMNAWWCDSYGNKLEPLLLISVGAPTLQSNQQIYPLVFSCLQKENSQIRIGEKAPVCLLLEETAADAVVGRNAMDENQQLWLVRKGTVEPFKVSPDSYGNNEIQLPDEMAGSLVVLMPDRYHLYEGMKLNRSEGL